MKKYDLTTEAGTRAYLASDLNLDVKSVKGFGDGSLNFVWRVELNTQYKGQNSVVVKHAAPFALADQNAEIGVGRLTFENNALEMISSERSIIGEDELVTVPAAYHYDSKKHVLIMHDVGSLPTLYDLISAKRTLSADMLTVIGTKLATFIAGVHNWGRNNEKVHAKLSNNKAGRTVMDDLGYQTVIPKAAEYGISDPLLATVVDALADEDRTSQETVIMGDFWTQNVMVDLEDTGSGEKALKKIWIIDWEGCRYGTPAVDVTSLVGDCYLLSRFYEQKSAEVLRHSFLKTYASKAFSKVDPLRVVTGVGIHWIMWAKIVGGENTSHAEVKECMEKGVDYIHKSWEKSEGWLRSSLIRELVD
ncbi:kinase-like domain-containing protein [Crepidotus variabilis]|uniref:Kinase-like domain-containing protein n=1 Tax=Crepidotus variabilis TaxID=179855 RepID=A0A9P6EH94_9AGAR|nr:kinase-like domain-containing protein [Crepidotus variabilis]